MFLLYLDASGTSDVGDADQKHYVLLGLSVHEGNWFALEKRVAALKRRYEFSGVKLELHAKDICCSIGEQALIPDFERLDHAARRAQVLSIREQKLAAKSGRERQRLRERFRATEHVIHLTRRERSQLYEDVLDLVGSHNEIRLFGEVVDKPHLLRRTGKRSAVGPAFEQVVSRFDQRLQVLDRADSQQVNNGLLVADVDQHSDLMRDLTNIFRSAGHQWGTLQHVIDTPFFVDSKTVSGIQLADVCAYALRRYVDKDQRAGSHEEKNFMRIFHKFDRARKLHGLRHYCEPGTCACAICVERDHA